MGSDMYNARHACHGYCQDIVAAVMWPFAGMLLALV